MAARYGHTWLSQYGVDPSGVGGREWRATLTGLDDEELRYGFAEDARRASEWPPSSTWFRALCFGVPSFARIREEVNGDAPSAFAFAVTLRVDQRAYRHAAADKADRMLREAYELVREEVVAGKRLPPPRRPLPAPEPEERVPASAATAEANIAALRGVLGESLPEPTP